MGEGNTCKILRRRQIICRRRHRATINILKFSHIGICMHSNVELAATFFATYLHACLWSFKIQTSCNSLLLLLAFPSLVPFPHYIYPRRDNFLLLAKTAISAQEIVSGESAPWWKATTEYTHVIGLQTVLIKRFVQQ